MAIHRPVTNAALVFVAANFLIFCYLYIWLEGVWGQDDAVNKVKWAVPAGAATFAGSIIM